MFSAAKIYTSNSTFYWPKRYALYTPPLIAEILQSIVKQPNI